MANLANFVSYFSMNAWEGELIFPPWMLLESKRIMSPALHYSNCPFPMQGSWGDSSSQSLLLYPATLYLLDSSSCTLSLLVFGTTCSPPTPSDRTSTKGTIPCTQWNPRLQAGFWSMCRFSTKGDQLAWAVLFHQGRQQMKVSKLVISDSVPQIMPKTDFTLGWVRMNQEAWEWQPPQDTKKPMDPLPGQFLSFQVDGSSRLMPLPSAYSHSQKRSVAFCTSSLERTFLMTTDPFSRSYLYHCSTCSSQKVLFFNQLSIIKIINSGHGGLIHVFKFDYNTECSGVVHNGKQNNYTNSSRDRLSISAVWSLNITNRNSNKHAVWASILSGMIKVN